MLKPEEVVEERCIEGSPIRRSRMRCTELRHQWAMPSNATLAQLLPPLALVCPADEIRGSTRRCWQVGGKKKTNLRGSRVHPESAPSPDYERDAGKAWMKTPRVGPASQSGPVPR